jgi:hypothetical protein
MRVRRPADEARSAEQRAGGTVGQANRGKMKSADGSAIDLYFSISSIGTNA